MNTMGIIQRGTSSILVTLPAHYAARRIEQAIRKRASARVVPKSIGESATLTGTLQRVDGDTLAIAIATGDVSADWQSAYCDVSFDLGGEEYLFTSVVLEVDRARAAARLLLSHPESVQTWQRRRFVRAAVADSAPIRIEPAEPSGELPIEGRILNLSVDGAACRVPSSAADGLAIGDRVGLVFAIGSAAQEMRLNGTLITKTAGGTPGTVILGLQFEVAPTDCPQRKRLAAALREYQ